jgi:hypothetical protein
LDHSCQTSSGTFADPAVRLQQLVSSFGDRGSLQPLCANSYSDLFSVIANLIGRELTRQCVGNGGVLGDPTYDYSVPTPLPPPGQVLDPAHYSCEVDDAQYYGTAMALVLDTLQPCNPAGQPSGKCFALIGDDVCSLSGLQLVACRNGFDPTNHDDPCTLGPEVTAPGDTLVLRCLTVR